MEYPGNKKFVFTFLDDTDSSTLKNIEPIYRYFDELGMRTTKTVWPLEYEDHLNSPFMYSATLADEAYLAFVRWIHQRGFEVTWHGATMESSKRESVIEGLNRFKALLGFYPAMHVNHANNHDNLYWGLSRFDSRLIQWILKFAGYRTGNFCGELPGSEYFWGDYAAEIIKYCRSFSYEKLNSLDINPSLPYADPSRPEIDYWFSTSEADSIIEFEKLVTKKNVDNLVAARGICILSTHLGKGYCKNGQVRDSVKRVLDYIASKDGWFVPVGELLQWRLLHGQGKHLSNYERYSMEFHWLFQHLKRRLPSGKQTQVWWEY